MDGGRAGWRFPRPLLQKLALSFFRRDSRWSALNETRRDLGSSNAVGALAIAYLALDAYAMFSGHPIVPGDPIQIFRRPDAPSYSGSIN